MPAPNRLLTEPPEGIPIPSLTNGPDITGLFGDPDDLVSTNQQEEGEAMDNIYRFLVASKTKDPKDPSKEVHTYYVFTTSIFADAKEEELYHRSLESKSVEGHILAVKPGTYRLRLMEEQALAQGMHFRACVFSSKSLKTINDLNKRANRQTVFWATEENATFLALMPNRGQKYFDQSLVDNNFGFDLLDIDADYDEKMTKRYQEILRSTDKNIFIKSGSEVEWTECDHLWTLDRAVADILHPHHRLVIAEFKTPDWKYAAFGADADKIYDGANVVDAELVLRALLEQKKTASIKRQISKLRWAIFHSGQVVVGRFTFRLFGRKGLVKGDCLAVVGLKERTGADVIYHTENLKPKARTRGWTVINFENHHPMHVANWDVQSPINFRNGLTEDQQLADLRRFQEWAEGVIDDPEPPKWVTMAQDFHSEEGDEDAEDQVEDQAADDYERYQAYHSEVDWRECRDVRESQNFPALWLNMTTARMERAYNSKTQFYDKPFIPMSNSVSVGLMTYSVLEDMALIDCSHMPHSVSHFMENVGMLWSDKRHIDTFDLAGTKDLDDTSVINKRRIYCDNPAHLAGLISDGVIGPMPLPIPTTAEEAIGWTGNGGPALIIRQPNGPGEYSIEWVSEDFPFQNTTEADKVTEIPAPVMNLAKLSRGVTHLVEELKRTLGVTQMPGLGEDPVRLAFRGQPFTRDQAHYILEAQQDNPGIGMVCNTLMLDTMATGSTLSTTMMDVLGEQVDAVQQGHDKVAIGNVKLQPEQILGDLANKLVANPSWKVDAATVANRFRGIRTPEMREIRQHMKPDRPTKLSNEYRKVYLHIMDLKRKRINAMRNSTPLAQAVMRLSFTAGVMQDARIRFENLNETLHNYDRIFRPKEIPGQKTPTFAVMAMRKAKAEAVKTLIEGAVAELQADPATMDRKIIAMYKYALTPITKYPQGSPDRCIFQSGGADVALFDLLAQAISRQKDIIWPLLPDGSIPPKP